MQLVITLAYGMHWIVTMNNFKVGTKVMTDDGIGVISASPGNTEGVVYLVRFKGKTARFYLAEHLKRVSLETNTDNATLWDKLDDE